MFERKAYLETLVMAKDNGFPKVITGIRRCGKSFLLKEIYASYLIGSGIRKENIHYIDLDDDANISLRNPLALGKYVRTLADNGERHYVFLDEIQKVFTIVNPELTGGKIVLAKKDDEAVVSFVDVVLGLSREKNIDLYVTGSNSKMLSSDIVTEFRDKATNIPLAPLSFEEYFSFVGGSSSEALYEYMLYGGMPMAVLEKDEAKKRRYLEELFNLTYLRDIVERNRVDKPQILDILANILASSTGSYTNPEKIANTFKTKEKVNIGKQTINIYISYFIDAFLLKEAKRFDLKGRKEIGANKKYYFLDTGLRNARSNFAYDDEGLLLENVVYNELVHNGYAVNVGVFDTIEKNKEGKSERRTNEVDFYAKKGNRVHYIQVAENLSSSETREREMRPFSFLRDNIDKIVVVNKPIREMRDEKGNIIIGAADFLLRYIKG